jgi:hypothetical protein
VSDTCLTPLVVLTNRPVPPLACGGRGADDRRVPWFDDFEAYRLELATVLEQPLVALETLTETRATLDRLERLLVDEARRRRSSWEEIGRALGISRQAAHRRHGRFVTPSAGVWDESDTGGPADGKTAPRGGRA